MPTDRLDEMLARLKLKNPVSFSGRFLPAEMEPQKVESDYAWEPSSVTRARTSLPIRSLIPGVSLSDALAIGKCEAGVKKLYSASILKRLLRSGTAITLTLAARGRIVLD